jgi:hypothetical protein
MVVKNNNTNEASPGTDKNCNCGMNCKIYLAEKDARTAVDPV